MRDDPKSTVQSVAKVFAVLGAFASGDSALTITEVAAASGLDRGTAYRLVNTLASLGYLASVPQTRRYRLTLKCLDLGYAALAGGGLKSHAAPLLNELVPEHGDAASLGMLDAADVVYVDRVQVDLGRRDMDRRAGSRTGAYAAALGHVLLAWRSPDEARALLESSDRVRLSERTVVGIDDLMDRLAVVRARGYAVSDGENAFGLRTVAAPILTPDGHPLAGISLTIRNERSDLETFVSQALPPLLRTTEALTKAVRLTSGRIG